MTRPQGIRHAAWQAMAAARMHLMGLATVEYQQPAHDFLVEKLPNAPELHRQVVLPGARRAVHHDALAAMHKRGLDQHGVVAEINAQTDAALRPQIERFEQWRDVELASRLARAREREERRIALQHARDRAIEEQLDRELGPVD